MTIGNPISLAIAMASFLLFAIPFLGCLRLIFRSSSLNLFLSSAKSIASGDVPSIGIFDSFNALHNLSGVWPPNCTMIPRRVPFEFYFYDISSTSTSVSGSK